MIVRCPVSGKSALNPTSCPAKLSVASRFSRFQHSVAALSPGPITRFTQFDYDREMALLVLVPDVGEIAGVARYFPNPDRISAEVACAVPDQWQAVASVPH